MKPSSIFKSRWMALLWASGMIWLALDVAESSAPAGSSLSESDQPSDTGGAPVSTADEQKLAEIIRNL